MLSSRFFRRIFLPYLLLICAATGTVGVFAAVRWHASYLRQTRQTLQDEALLVSDVIQGDLSRGDATAVEREARRLGAALNCRITVIADDGTVSVLPDGQPAESLAAIGRIKLVNPDPSTLVREGDGLFQLASGGSAPADASVKLSSGVLESSNVDLASAMVNMIDLARNFQLQVKAMKSADDNASASSQLLQST